MRQTIRWQMCVAHICLACVRLLGASILVCLFLEPCFWKHPAQISLCARLAFTQQRSSTNRVNSQATNRWIAIININMTTRIAAVLKESVNEFILSIKTFHGSVILLICDRLEQCLTNRILPSFRAGFAPRCISYLSSWRQVWSIHTDAALEHKTCNAGITDRCGCGLPS